MPAHLLPLSFNGDNYAQLFHTLDKFLDYALTLALKERPTARQGEKIKFCYIGTASHDSLVEDIFFNGFTCLKFGLCNIGVSVSKLSLTTSWSPNAIEEHICEQDILFFGGGDTEFMLKTWQETGFENILKTLKEIDCLPIIMGLSAGGIFLFESAISLNDGKNGDEYKLLKPGYNWIPNSFCPHADAQVEATYEFDGDNKHYWISAFEMAIKSGKSPAGYAVPDDCMLHFHGEKLVGAFSTREEIQYGYVTQEGTEWRNPQLLIARELEQKS